MIMVDDLFYWPGKKAKCFVGGSCHLTTDGDLQELHDFAARLGLKRSWFQDHRVMPHYDLTKSKRDTAIALGAKVVPAREQIISRRLAKAVLS